MDILMNKEQLLNSFFSEYDNALVAFSGGIDSTVVLKAAINNLGKENVTAVIVNSELFTDEEFDKAVDLANSMHANVVTTNINYLSNEHIRMNRSDSWYYAKKMFYIEANRIKAKLNLNVVLDGMIMDDLDDYRPGMVAKNEEGCLSPLQAAEMYKDDVRDYAKSNNLLNWNKVPSCSISSRFPYNSEITQDAIEKVMNSERLLRNMGFATVRVRIHGDIARIEVNSDQMAELISNAKDVNKKLKQFGFKYVTVDLGGFVSGHMNEALSEKQLNKFKA